MFVKIFFTVNMFISIDYEVMINYVKEKISLHTLSKQTGKVYLKKQTKKNQISWNKQQNEKMKERKREEKWNITKKQTNKTRILDDDSMQWIIKTESR